VGVMARPQKEGLDYFPLDVDIDQDDKVAVIEAQHGVTGFAVVIKLLMKIYKNGYFYQWTEKEQLLFSRLVNVDINELNVIINDCVKWGLFSEKLYQEGQILTSKGIQLRYLEASTRRQEVHIKKSHLLIEEDKVNVYKNLYIDGVNVYINPQSKVKESKEKKSNIKTTTENPVIFYESNLGRLSPLQMQEIWSLVDDFKGNADIVIYAMKLAMDRNRKNMGFVKFLCKEWSDKGAATLTDVQALEIEFSNRKGDKGEADKQRPGSTGEERSKVREAIERRKGIASKATNSEANQPFG
jgi:DnaD/phage-associated family protein